MANGDATTSTGSQAEVGHAVGKIRSPAPRVTGDEVEDHLVDLARLQRLADGGRATGDVDVPVPEPRAPERRAASKPSVTKWKVVPPTISIGSCA